MPPGWGGVPLGSQDSDRVGAAEGRHLVTEAVAYTAVSPSMRFWLYKALKSAWR